MPSTNHLLARPGFAFLQYARPTYKDGNGINEIQLLHHCDNKFLRFIDNKTGTFLIINIRELSCIITSLFDMSSLILRNLPFYNPSWDDRAYLIGNNLFPELVDIEKLYYL